MSSWSLSQKIFNEKVTIALINTAKDLAKLKNIVLPEHNLITPISSDYYVVNINSPVNGSDLEHYLQKHLEAMALQEDFEYGIYDCYSNAMVDGAYVKYSNDGAKSYQSSNLPTYTATPYNFGVRFPKKSTFILSSMKITIVFTVILLLAVSFFLYSIFVILQQKRLSEMQKDFINNMTHEFKTPISTIKIAADVLGGNSSIQADQRLSKYVSILKDQNNRLNNQVEKVLQLARIEKDSFKLNIESTDLHTLLLSIAESNEVKVHEINGNQKVLLDSFQPIIEADCLHFTNILHNLLDNAIKYHKGIPDITISTKKESSRELSLCIADKGIGIKKEYHQKVFDKFFRVPTGNVHNVKGFGLGLFYVKNICDAHGWKINLDSKEGEGVTICIKIPYKNHA